MASVGIDREGVRIIAGKVKNLVIKVDNVDAPAANIIKQQLLSLGGDAAVHRDAIKGSSPSSTVYIVADRRRLTMLTEKLKYQPFGLAELGENIKQLIHIHDHPPEKILLSRGEIDLTNAPIIMGVLNVTPDSFSDGGKFLDPERASERVFEMIEEGAAMIDIGGESTRPGAAELSAEEELARVMPVLERLAGRIAVPISIDTRKAAVAKAAVEHGALIINDISALRHDPEMINTVLGTKAAVVVMHMQGTPTTMQENPFYEDAVSEIIEWLRTKTAELISHGLSAEKIIIDPGIGFGKRLHDNLEIIHEIGDFLSFGFPLMVGYSRKSFLGMVTGREIGERVWGGFAALGKCLEGGVQIVRVHDVRETADFIKVWKAIERKDIVS